MTDSKTCPFCAEEIAAAAIKCKHCGEMLTGPDSGSVPVYDYPPDMIKIPMLVSACWNVMTAGLWVMLVPCFGILVAVPYAVLAFFEITTFQASDSMPPRELYDRCGWIGGFQILLGLTNLVPVVCGVLLIAYRGQLRDYHA